MENEPPIVETPLAESQQPLEEGTSAFWKILSRPYVQVITFIAALASIIAIPLSVYLFTLTQSYPQLTYYVYPIRAAVLQTGQASKLAATFDNQPVQSDITVAQVAVWNEGRRAVKRTDILKPLVISTEGNVPILEATLTKITRDVTQLSLNTDELQRGRVTVNWSILEQNDGGFIQLIYAGNPQVRIQAEGVVEGQPKINFLEFTGTIKSAAEQYESERRSYSTYYLFLIAGVMGFVAFSIRKAKLAEDSALAAALKQVEEAYNSQLAFYDQMLKWQRDSVKQYTQWIAEFEAKEPKTPFLDATIRDYKYQQQKANDKIEEYERLKGQALADKTETLTVNRVKGHPVAFLFFLGLACITFGLGLYVLVSRPLGPPFGF